jgi:hypothetical protein
VFTVKGAGLKEISLNESLPGSDAQVSESAMIGSFEKKVDDRRYRGLARHELTHQYDGSQNRDADERGWRNLNEGAIPYAYDSGPEAIAAHQKDQSGAVLSEEVPGYAKRYGQEGGSKEDKACISEYVLNPDRLPRLVERAATDEILKRKIEFMTGYRLEDGAFGRPVTDQEYRDMGFPGRTYWSRWSQDASGTIWMDAEYYNALLRGDDVTFSERDGRTVRTITPAAGEAGK